MRTGSVLWCSRADGPVKNIVPDGVMDLMWFRDQLVIAGPDAHSAVIDTHPGEVTRGLRLTPGMTFALFGVPAHELTGQRVELSEIATLPRNVDYSFERDPWATLERVFLALWEREEPDHVTLRKAGLLDRAARAGRSVHDVARVHEVSERTIRRLSNAYFGYGLKSLAQIYRFQHALHLVRSGHALAEAGAIAGYADQSHFARESMRLTGQTLSTMQR